MAAKDEDELKGLIQKCWKKQLRFTVFREPDLGNQITAVAIEPSDDTQKLCSSFPLAFQQKKKDDIIFHFNKKHNEDPTVPAWVIKHKGSTHYVNHIEVLDGVAWNTKETPDNPHTKGSLKFKGNLELKSESGNTIAIIK